MVVEFLTDERAAVYGRFGQRPSRPELERFCFLDDADLGLINKRRGSHSRLGFALQLVTVRAAGAFLSDPLDVPTVVLDDVAAQLGIADPSVVKRYTERRTGVQRVLERNPAPELIFAGQKACYPTCSMTGASVSRVTQQGRELHKQTLPPDHVPKPSVPRYSATPLTWGDASPVRSA